MCLNVKEIPLSFRPPEEHICNHAYFLWENAGKPDQNFWEQAENECNYIVAYKVLKKLNNAFYSPIKFDFQWQEGVVKMHNISPPSIIVDKIENVLVQIVRIGIHVFLNKNDAKEVASNIQDGVIIPVHCYKNHFVANGHIASNQWYIDVEKCTLVWGSKKLDWSTQLPQAAVFTQVTVPNGALCV